MCGHILQRSCGSRKALPFHSEVGRGLGPSRNHSTLRSRVSAQPLPNAASAHANIGVASRWTVFGSADLVRSIPAQTPAPSRCKPGREYVHSIKTIAQIPFRWFADVNMRRPASFDRLTISKNVSQGIIQRMPSAVTPRGRCRREPAQGRRTPGEPAHHSMRAASFRPLP